MRSAIYFAVITFALAACLRMATADIPDKPAACPCGVSCDCGPGCSCGR